MYYLTEYADYIVDNLRNGDLCIADIRRHILLDSYLRTLICNVPRDEVRSQGQIRLDSANPGATVLVSINVTVAATGPAVPYPGSIPQWAEDVATAINNFVSTPDYFATVIPGTGYVNIYAMPGQGDTPNGFVVGLTFGGTGVATGTVVYNMQDGEDAQDIDDMCLTEDEFDDIFKHISSLTGLCWVPFDGTYYQPYVAVAGTGVGLPIGIGPAPPGTTTGLIGVTSPMGTDGGDGIITDGGDSLVGVSTESYDRGVK